ncbi:MAG: ATP-binding protein [Thermoplasmata archaeon]
MTSIRDALNYQKNELEAKPAERYIARKETINGSDSDLIKVIIGPRRAGKSFFAIHALSHMGTFGYVNYDDETLANAGDYNDVIEEVNSIYSKPRYLLLDEIQNLDKWELFVNRLQRQGYNLVITGSNSNLLSLELSTHLTGRHVVTRILPLSYLEIINSYNRNLTESQYRVILSEYLTNGGYPEPFVKKLSYSEYLSTLFASVVYKDIVRRYRVRKPRTIDELAEYLISNTSREFSYTRLANMTGLKSAHSVKRYIDFLKESFIFFELERYSTKVSEKVKANKKMYCIDNGFIRSNAYKNSRDRGVLYENTVAVELLRRSHGGKFKLYFWKDDQHHEVDFVVKQGEMIKELIQVCSDPSETFTMEREVRSLITGSELLGCKQLLVITDSVERTEKRKWYGATRNIKYIPLWKWLIS